MRDRFNREEWARVKALPAQIYMAVAYADGMLDERDGEAFQSALMHGLVSENDLLKELIIHVLADPEAAARGMDSIEASRTLLSARLESEEYEEFAATLLIIFGIDLAEAAHGVGKEEQVVFDDLVRIFGLDGDLASIREEADIPPPDLGLADAMLEDGAESAGEPLLEEAEEAEEERRLEEAEAGYEEALSLFRLVGWATAIEATILSQLGEVRRGLDRTEEAEEVLREAVEAWRGMVETKPQFTRHLLSTLNAWGNALTDMDRLDEAEAAHREAVDLSRKLPEDLDRARALNDHGIVLAKMGRTEDAEAAFRESSRLHRTLPEEHDPELSDTLVNLGRVLVHLRQPEGAEQALRDALEIRYRLWEARSGIDEDATKKMMAALNDLGVVQYHLGRFEDALETHRTQLETRKRLAELGDGADEEEVAQSLNNMGIALHDLGRLEEAEAAHREALLIRERLAGTRPEDFLSRLAMTLGNLAGVLKDLDRPEEALEVGLKAVQLYRQLAGSRPETYRVEVASALNSTGTILWQLDHLEDAEASFNEALELLGSDDRPDQRRMILSNFGKLRLEQGQYEEATELLRDAIREVEQLRGEMFTIDRRLALLRGNVPTYEALVVCLMKLKRPLEALEAAEQAKSRTLIDLLTLRELRPRNAAEELTREYEQMLFRARALEEELNRQPASGGIGDPTSDEGARIRGELARTASRVRDLAGKIRAVDPEFLPHAAPLGYEDIIRLAGEAEATLALFRVSLFKTGPAGTYVFLVFPDGTTDVVEVPSFTAGTLEEVLVKTKGDRIVDGWVGRQHLYELAQAGGAVDEIVRARRRWLEGMDETLEALYEQLLRPVHAALRAKGAREVVFVPNRGLAILPLHACWWEENGQRRYLLDELTVRYAPSLSVFKRCLDRERGGRRHNTLLAVANPQGNLVFSDWECAEIERLVGHERTLVLRGPEAIGEAIHRWAPQRHVLHFSCHGQYLLDRPLESALFLAGGEALTMGEIFEDLHLPEASLVSLSACETGLVDFREVADEHYGLPMAFLYAGAPTVYASLWQVNDLSTALLMANAYEGVVKSAKSKGTALQEAQVWVRDLTAEKVDEVLFRSERGAASESLVVAGEVRGAPEAANEVERGDRPFAHPYWWAAFQCVGA